MRWSFVLSALFVTSRYDGLFTFPNQTFGGVWWFNAVRLRTINVSIKLS